MKAKNTAITLLLSTVSYFLGAWGQIRTLTSKVGEKLTVLANMRGLCAWDMLRQDVIAGERLELVDGVLSVGGVEHHNVELVDAAAFFAFCDALRLDHEVRHMSDFSALAYLELDDCDIEIVEQEPEVTELELLDVTIIQDRRPARRAYSSQDKSGWVRRWQAARMGAHRWVAGLRGRGFSTPAASSLYRWAKREARVVQKAA